MLGERGTNERVRKIDDYELYFLNSRNIYLKHETSRIPDKRRVLSINVTQMQYKPSK